MYNEKIIREIIENVFMYMLYFPIIEKTNCVIIRSNNANHKTKPNLNPKFIPDIINITPNAIIVAKILIAPKIAVLITSDPTKVFVKENKYPHNAEKIENNINLAKAGIGTKAKIKIILNKINTIRKKYGFIFTFVDVFLVDGLE